MLGPSSLDFAEIGGGGAVWGGGVGEGEWGKCACCRVNEGWKG